MKKGSALMALFTAFSFASHAQGFSQLSQTPLLINPSFAGSTGGGRLSLASNVSRINYAVPYTYINSHLSYDDLWRKKGIGWGISLSNLNRSGFKHAQTNDDGGYKIGSVTYYGLTEIKDYSNFDLGLYISPKYALKNTNKETTWTFAPSLAFNYIRSNFQRESSYYRDSLFSAKLDYDGYTGGTVTNSILNRPQNEEYKATVGFMLNSKKSYVGITYSHSIMSSNYLVNIYDKTTSNHQTFNFNDFVQTNSYTSKQTISHGTFSIMMGKSFTVLEKSNFTLTPLFYLGIGTYYNQNPDYNGRLFNPTGMAFNLTATWNRFYSGFSVTSATSASRNLFVGYKTDDFRLGVAYGFGKEPLLNKGTNGYFSNETKFFGEVSFTYYFKKSKEYRKF